MFVTKLCVCEQVVCERERVCVCDKVVTKFVLKDGVCDKVVCEKLCVKEIV